MSVPVRVFFAGVLVAAGVLTWVVLRPTGASRCAAMRDHNEGAAGRRTEIASTMSGPTVVFFGDSYTQGRQLDDVADTYLFETARRMGWRPVVDGFGGTGFVNEGPCGDGALGRRVDAVLAHEPEVVVVLAGLNDHNSEGVVTAATEVLTALRACECRVVAVSPPAVPKIDTTRVTHEIAAAAAAAGVEYVDGSEWEIPTLSDGIHPTAAGHALLGGLLADALAT